MRADFKPFIARLIIATILVFVGSYVADRNYILSMAITLVAYLLAGYEVLFEMFKGLFKGRLFDENFLMGIASLGAFAIGEQAEAVAVLIFYGIGELCQNMALARSRGNIQALMNIRPDYANLVGANGEVSTVKPEAVAVGSTIIIKPGEKIPLDGVVAKGDASIDTAALTGESMPRSVSQGDTVLSGSINLTGLIEVETTADFGRSTVSKILELVENASAKKAESEKFITKFAKVYTPLVVGLALLVAVVPPIFVGDFPKWIYSALSFLIISCPCALVLSIPLSFFGGIGGSARHGILVKGGNFLEALNLVDTVVFDKTGTLTKGTFAVNKVVTQPSVDEKYLVECAAICEKHSNHPIAMSIMDYYKGDVPDYQISEESGLGMSATMGGRTILSGNEKLMKKHGIAVTAAPDNATVVYVAENGKYLGYIAISDQIKPEAKEAIAALKREGVKNIVMLTGDREEVARDIAKSVGITDYKASLLPQDKVSALENVMAKSGGKTVFVGDGINDAPVLARADIGIAMGGIGSDAAIEAADVVIMNDNISKLAHSIKIARKTRSVVMQNIIFALGVKLIIMILSFLGITSIWFAIFADVGVALIAILNAMRAMYIKL